jgi:hypothetical protein
LLLVLLLPSKYWSRCGDSIAAYAKVQLLPCWQGRSCTILYQEAHQKGCVTTAISRRRGASKSSRGDSTTPSTIMINSNGTPASRTARQQDVHVTQGQLGAPLC